MKNYVKTIRKSQEGFTLVELAVVMIIIGLLIAGVLKGQELIANARITSTISQMQGIGAAVDGFTEAYNAQPGDMANAQTRLVGCAAPCNNGDGSGRVSVAIGTAPALGAGAAGEGSNFYLHLAQANFITGINNTGAAANFGGTNPTAPIGGGFTVGDTLAAAPTGYAVADFRTGTYIVLTGSVAAVGAGTGALDATQAARIDRRLDDGVPNTGVVISDNSGAAAGAVCRDAAGTAYNEGNQTSNCSIAFQM